MLRYVERNPVRANLAVLAETGGLAAADENAWGPEEQKSARQMADTSTEKLELLGKRSTDRTRTK